MSRSGKYTKDLLDTILKDSNASLLTCLNDNSKLTCDTMILFACQCEKTRERSFRYIVKYGAFCKTCTLDIKKDNSIKEGKANRNYNKQLLEEIMEQCNAQFIKSDPSVLTRDSKIYFRCLCDQEAIKVFRPLVEYGAYCENCQEEVKIERMKETSIEHLGVSNPFLSPEVQQKYKETMYNKHGVFHPWHIPGVKERVDNTMIERHGNKNPQQCQHIQEKNKATNLQKYGSEYYFQTEEFKERMKAFYIDKHGVENPMQIAEINYKSMMNGYKFKEFQFASGKIVNIQGYECFALNKLIHDGVHEDDIRCGVSEVDKINYIDEEGKNRIHFPDIYIKSCNKFIEVKSKYTASVNPARINAKKESAINQGYNYEIWVFSKSGKIIEIIQ